MRLFCWTVLLIYLLHFIEPINGGDEPKNETGQALPDEDHKWETLQRMFAKYDQSFPPTLGLINVSVQVTLWGVFQVDAKTETVTLMLSYELSWQDDRLATGSFDWDVSSDRVWIPGLVIPMSTAKLAFKEHTDANVLANGRVSVRRLYNVRVRIDFHEITYPFDRQTVCIPYVPWSRRHNVQLGRVLDNTNHTTGLTAFTSSHFGCTIRHSEQYRKDYIVCMLEVTRNGVPYIFSHILPLLAVFGIALLGILSNRYLYRQPRAQIALTACVAIAVHLGSLFDEMPNKFTATVPWFVSLNGGIVVALFVTVGFYKASAHHGIQAEGCDDPKVGKYHRRWRERYWYLALASAPVIVVLFVVYTLSSTLVPMDADHRNTMCNQRH